SGFAHLGLQHAGAAADELERSMRELKFCGAMINGHTNGKYLDDRSLDPFWERAGFGCARLSAPGRPGHAGSGIGRLQRAAAGDLGMDVRDRLARSSHLGFGVLWT